MLISNNGDKLDNLLNEYIANRNNWKVWEILRQKHDEAVKEMDWETLEKFLNKGVLSDFKIRKAA